MDQLTNNWGGLVAEEVFVPTWSRATIRVLDIVGAVVLLVSLVPLFVIIALCVFVSDPGPIFFSHHRVGRGGAMFPCLKFRTMVVDAAQRLNELLMSDPIARAEWTSDHKLRRDPRVTPIGAFLRKTSLDELPQLFNVLRNEMSLVGPRPISLAEITRYGCHIREYASVLPGITGLWQVSGRNDVSYAERVALDVAFVGSYSVRLYLKIALVTVPVVLCSRGSY